MNHTPDSALANVLDRPKPRSKRELFFAFSRVAVQGFGGVLAVVQREVVERKKWLTPQEFMEEWAVAQIMPGPYVVNLAFIIGHRYHGLGGALAAAAGMFCLPLLILIALASVYAHFAAFPQLAGAIRGMGAASAALIIATGLRLLPALKNHPLGLKQALLCCGVTIVAMTVFHLHIALVLFGWGALVCYAVYRRL
ncbi:chromate transporter [Massilia sp. W12]|uniref:chromate transporter n=1 Tax=Massilia sp. W12 TaxID=3126507 RepID=UPI0030CBCC1C